MGMRRGMVSFRMMAVMTFLRTGAIWLMAKTWLKATKSNSMRHGTSAKASLWPRTSLEGPVDQVVPATATVAAAMVVEEVMVAVAATMVEARASKVARAKVQVADLMVATMVEEARAMEVARAKVGDCFCAARHNVVKSLAQGPLHQ